MSTYTKTGPKNAKKAKCKMATPISNDRAEAFVGPQADVSPRFSEIPSERDAKAFLLASQGVTQREIAKHLKISQPTVQRTIVKYRGWFGTTLPEDRGEMIGFPRFRVAVEERRVLRLCQPDLGAHCCLERFAKLCRVALRALDPARRRVDEGNCDLGSADVDPDGADHYRHRGATPKAPLAIPPPMLLYRCGVPAGQ